jgi:hypothetical protein
MSTRRSGRAAALIAGLILTIAACGGAAGPANDPVGTVNAAIAAAQSGGIAKLTDFACAAHKNDIAGAFGGSDLSALTAAGIKPEDIFGAMSMAFANVSATQTSKTDTTATVHVTGDMKITIDKEKFKTIAKAMFTAQGLPADDTTVNAMVDAMAGQMSSTHKLDEDINVVNEGGKWLICES